MTISETRSLSTLSIEDLQAQHQSHERRLEELTRKPWLTPDEEFEQKRLKKLKLRIKDQLEALHRHSAS